MRLSRTPLVLLLTLFLVPIACRQLAPEERVEGLRAQYTAELNSFYVEPAEEEMAEEPMEEGAAAEEADEAEPAEEGEEGEEGEEPAEEGEEAPEEEMTPQNVVLDILVSTEAMEYLPGLTLDVSQIDSAGNEKDHWRVWVDTTQVVRGPGTQVTKVLEDVDYQEGDGFAVEVRPTVPPAERGEYREFSEAAG